MDAHELTKSLEELKNKLTEMRAILKLDKKQEDIKKLEKQTSEPDFWKDQEKASEVGKELSDLQEEYATWEKLDKEVGDLLEMARMDEADKEVDMREDLEKQYKLVNAQVGKLEFNTLMDGKHDAKGAIVAIHAGSGGTEAQDWAQMLERMYLRYSEKKKWKVTILDESKGSEAGIKSVTFRVAGRYAYGHMKSEHGTHRLVRISPFDAEKMRHTSFALVEVIPEMDDEGEVKINEKDLRIDTFMAGGHGGQSVNTTYSAVRVVHLPTNITVSIQNEKSQLQNKKVALKVLQSKLQKLQEEKEEEERLKLRGEYTSPEWGSQIRSYVLHPYHMVKDLRSRYETVDDQAVLDGELDPFIEAYLKFVKQNK
ncbi:MAG: peptide chain release factor 2 [Candidatus Magasanikbacteria bacterium]|jgi:peptide chain release factor 2|nr:peptide chain release factor 2 [Candidatus Magasanikbacteria bacterium]MBT4315272.1 peptide chain release factor 2 [Candidatus Magasanikbacteria bacterium]MBT4547333.1 peptide chain release factor 2 [Candidatus Magasanikbacteria bacterium]MBT6819320.1 peptide chain release factor 2 [Candidatus Magasanikbacteria bacterium]